MTETVRTTITLDSDAYRIVKNFAEAKKLSLGNAISELVRKSVAEKHIYGPPDFPVFAVSEKARPFGLTEVLAEEDSDQ
ncbi:MAG TPA: CopG family transcriptional regulator [Treponemataceae bacterium]|jgi:hypothetical protein|nr:CopG family transcriptional regulator [Treponemataceae bacterium]HPX46818.1 CopG family transcriptional regulator [Treponemataceae bacterium]HQL32843.1 CopG family transcriptional regulator [Treponemataceae bacterium]